MLRQMSRRGRVDALLQDGLQDGRMNGLANILQPAVKTSDFSPTPLDSAEIAAVFKKASNLPRDAYDALLVYLQATGHQYRAYDAFPHPPNALILPPRVELPLQVHRGDHTFSCQHSHEGNSTIQFRNPHTQEHDTGFIEAIWRVPLEGAMHTFFVVRPHQQLPNSEEEQAPFVHFPGFMSRIVDTVPSKQLMIIQPVHLITHLTTFRRPSGTYGIPRETIIICWALNRGRW